MALSHDASAVEVFWSKQASALKHGITYHLLGIADIIYVYSTIWYSKMQSLCKCFEVSPSSHLLFLS